ncbi:ionotropic receptor 21a [Hyposmocoma kahamanoa]|uniref:ionotropic receptor 21a n=1 Tax=Hyposmocoma kahamanoa TaxID=1477025 RepID=UPI000E6D7433|nr:ionotropic receptor 21a [Hyposmocoma kahamanoa]
MTRLKYTVILMLTLELVNSQEIEYYPSQSALNGFNAKANVHKVISKRDLQSKVIINVEESLANKSTNFKTNQGARKRATDPVFYGHPKTREEIWNEHFLQKSTIFDQSESLIKLVHNITLTYLYDCTPVILYDSQVKSKDSYLFQDLLKGFPVTFIHGYINDIDQLEEPKLLKGTSECHHFIVFLLDVGTSGKVLGKQSDSKVVVIARSSQWAVQEFLAGPLSRMFINLLVIGQSFREDGDYTLEAPYILYTHKLFIDGLGASKPVVLNSWTRGKFSREVNLFPKKMTDGYAGHRFVVAAANKPPFVIRRIKSDADGGNPRVTWDGIEIRMLKLLSVRNNFSIEIIDAKDQLLLGPGDAVARDISTGRADIGVAGMYMTSERGHYMDLSGAHSQDCAVFITLMSTALPRYRAILGPFHWHVWVALTFTYLFAIFPLAFSDKHTLRHLLHNSGEVENMFWYVFGTFTNCFTFVGKNSWTRTTKITTRLLIGWYWLFTIIITSCYTGSIIAFVTLPVFPETVDSIPQLLSGFYRIGTLDRGGWERWFFNSSDDLTNKLLKKMEFVPNVEAGIRNTTKAFFWPYAFLGSQAELEYIIQTNFTKIKSKRAVLHISNECFVPFGVTVGFPKNALHTSKLSSDIRNMLQSGIIAKLGDEVRWEVQKSSNGRQLSVGKGPLKSGAVEEKGLTLEDTQGMFLLLGAGFLMAVTSLLSEWMGGFTNRCRAMRNRTRKEIENNISVSEENLLATPKSTDDNIKIMDSTVGRLNNFTRSISAGSRETLDGQIINITEENILVHNNLDTDAWGSRRSSSVDLDREIREIFEKDESRKTMVDEDVVEVDDEDRVETARNGALFGDRLKSKI